MTPPDPQQLSHVAYTEPIRSRYAIRYAVGCETCGWKDDETYAHIEDARAEGRAHEAAQLTGTQGGLRDEPSLQR